MAAPLKSAKQSVDLARPGTKGSRIRRDPPPPPAKQLSLAERSERDARMVVIGIGVFTAALLVILLAVSSYTGWTPREMIWRW